MLLRLRLSPLETSISSSSHYGLDQNASFRDRLLILFASKSPASSSLRLIRRRSGRGFLRSRFCLHPFRASSGNVTPEPDVHGDEDSEQYLQASLLVPETISHYNLWKEGFIKKTEWHSPTKKFPFSSRRTLDFDDHSIDHGFLQRFQSPTVFLKIACDGDLLLPIIVGEFSINRLIEAITGEESEVSCSSFHFNFLTGFNSRLMQKCPDQFQFVSNIVNTLGYEVSMVRITDRVVNTYYARIYLRKAADNTNLSIDARPSDALNVAERFKAPIYVRKDVVLKDSIKDLYGSRRARSARVVYDVSLDSVPDEPDSLFEELDLVQKMNAAILEERFEDAALWRDKLTKLKNFQF